MMAQGALEKAGGKALSGPLRLNLGGAGEGFADGRIPGFLTVDLREGPDTDVVADCSRLNQFDDNTVDTIYASQILEHFGVDQTVSVLKEWHRVLKKGGKLYVSVPDFDVAVKLYQRYGLTPWLKYHLWGDQKHMLNFHYTCFTFATLAKDLLDAGFDEPKRCPAWPFECKDGSQNIDSLSGQLISLNMEATK